MWIRCRIPTAVGLFLLPALCATAAAQGDDKPIVQNAAPGRFQKIPNLPDCITAAVEQGDPTKGASVLLVKGARCTLRRVTLFHCGSNAIRQIRDLLEPARCRVLNDWLVVPLCRSSCAQRRQQEQSYGCGDPATNPHGSASLH